VHGVAVPDLRNLLPRVPADGAHAEAHTLTHRYRGVVLVIVLER
jgi:hypothetical protein